MKTKTDCKWLLSIMLVTLLLSMGSMSVQAADDVIPFFAGQSGSPNVMVLFDNSDSMQDSPYFRKDGNVYEPSTYWRRGVTINKDCDEDKDPDEEDKCIGEDASGNIIYDDSKYVTSSNVLILPGQLPPNLPGLASLGSSVTRIRDTSNACSAGMECDDRIYDTNVDWSLVNTTYRYWKVEIKDDLENVQYRTLDYYSTSSRYWTIYEAIDGYIEYDPARTYTYTLVPGTPGEVTRTSSDARYVYDRNFDWSTIPSLTEFNESYKGKTLEVYQGTNAGETRIIDWYSTTSGYWRVSKAFTNPLDYTSRYRIIGVADDGKLAQGGNHPDSKMYQAKLALQKFLDSDAIKTCDETDASGACIKERYLMNIGFATFLQARQPRVRAKYYRKIAAVPAIPGETIVVPDRYLFPYYTMSEHTADEYLPTGCVDGAIPDGLEVDFTEFGIDFKNKSNGDAVDRPWYDGSDGNMFKVCSDQIITYRVKLTCSPTDSLPGRVRVYLESRRSFAPDANLAGVDPYGDPQWGYTNFDLRSRDGTCAANNPPSNDGSWIPVLAGGCASACVDVPGYTYTTGGTAAKAAYLTTTWVDTWGDVRVTADTPPVKQSRGYIDPITNDVTPYWGYCGGTWNCTNPDPEVGEWTLLESELTDVINTDGDLGTLTPVIFDYSYFRYPGIDNDDDHPHGWSYQRTTRDPDWLTNYRYRKDDGSYLTDDHFIYVYSNRYPTTWREDKQKGDDDPDDDLHYFPSVPGSEFANYQGDDQIAFVDLPVVDYAAEDKGDDLTGVNVTRIQGFLNLSRQIYLRDTRYVHTMAPINPGSLPVNAGTAETGNGTPLAATLANARRYYESYIKSDTYTQGDCRDNYVILLTDGLETTSVGDPVAQAQALQNITVNGVKTPVNVYVIGFGLDGNSQETLNDIAVAGGTSKAYFANDVDSLVTILADDIASDITDGTYGRSKAALGANQPGVASSTALYYASFDYPVWRGHIDAIGLYPEDEYNADGTVLLHKKGALKGALPYWKTGCSGTYDPPSKPGDADSGCMVAEDNMVPGVPPDGPVVRRTLYTTVAGSRELFAPDSVDNVAALQGLVNPDALDIDSNGTADETNDAKAVVNYVHHPGFDAAKYVGTRDKNWPLADIYNSGLVVVTAPGDGDCVDPGTGEVWDNMDGYCVFKNAQASRRGVIYVGTNGGIIQAFETGKPEYVDTVGNTVAAVSGGMELWGYLPNFVLGKLHEFRDGHRFTMDLTVSVADIDTSTDLAGTGWKTILVAGQRKGGTGYAVIDVTDPDDPQPMWEFTDSNLGQTWSRPSFGRLMINGVKTSVIFFGGGFSPDSDKGNRLYIVNASDGMLIKEFVVGAAANNVPSGLRTMRYLTDSVGTVVDYRTNLAKLPDGTAIDYNEWRDFIEAAYFGDIAGTMWRLRDLNNAASPSTGDIYGPPWSTSVSLETMYVPDTGEGRPIYHAPFVHDIQKAGL